MSVTKLEGVMNSRVGEELESVMDSRAGEELTGYWVSPKTRHYSPKTSQTLPACTWKE